MLLELVLEILAIVLLSLCAVVLTILLIPFEVLLEFSKAGSSQGGSLAISWLGLTVYRVKPGARARPPEAKEAKQEDAGETGFDPGRLLRMLGLVRDSIPSILLIAKSLRRSVSIRTASVDVTFGLGDPADTALAAGYIWSVAWMLGFFPGASFAIHPDTERLRLDGTVAARVRVRLLLMVSAFLRAYLHGSFRSLIREARGG